MSTTEDRIGELREHINRLETTACRQRIGLVALACVVSLFGGCLSGHREGYYERKFRDMPVRAAYHAYWEGAGKATDALFKPSISVGAPSDASLVVMGLHSAYLKAGLSASAFVDRTSQFSEDAAKMRATADSRMKFAMDSFHSQSDNLRKWLDNYYEIEAKVDRANELARLAFEATGNQ